MAICGCCGKKTPTFIWYSLEEIEDCPIPVKMCFACLGKSARNAMGVEKLDMFRDMLRSPSERK